MTEEDDLDEFLSVLQDVMLPSRVPVLPGLDVATHFSMPADPAEATGAWFDVAPLGDGRVALVVGQVPGGGLATTLAAYGINAIVRASLIRDGDIAAAVSLADLHAQTAIDARGTSLSVAVVDPTTGDLAYLTAGHDAPVVVGGSSDASSLDPTGGRPLGFGSGHTVAHHHIAVGDLVVLGQAAAAEDVARMRVVGDATATATALARSAAASGHDVAVTVLAAELRASVVEPLVLDLAVDDTTGRRARHSLQTWLEGLGAPAMDALATVHAASELVANAVEHASDPEGDKAVVNIRGSFSPAGEVVVEVIDHGTWAVPSDDPARGRGLAMAAGLVDDLEISSDDRGTCATLRHRLSRPVRIERAAPRTSLPVPPIAVTSSAPGHIRLSGAFGPDDADRVGAELLLASRGGTRTVEVDLSEVTHVSADGVRMFGDLVARPSGGVLQRARVILHAPDGSVAHAALERARISDHGS